MIEIRDGNKTKSCLIYCTLFLFGVVQYHYLPDIHKRSSCHLGVVQCNTLQLFLFTWYCLPTERNWDFQPLYLALVPFWGDFWLYITHRLLHTRIMYQNVHYIHHESMLPQPIDTFYAHPFENFLQNWCIIGIPLLYWPSFSMLTLVICAPFLLLNTLAAHNTENEPQGFHVLHHSFYSRNFGAGFHLMDRLLDTYIP